MRDGIALFKLPFYYLRHGETESNRAQVVAGSRDVDLTPLGRSQALAAAAALAHLPITAIYSSPLTRARETAEPIARRLGLPVAIIPGIAERAWGALEGQPQTARVRGVTPEGAESAEDFRMRVLTGMAQIHAEVPLIVAHSGVFRVLCRTLELTETAAPVTNALPLRFAPLSTGGWSMEAA